MPDFLWKWRKEIVFSVLILIALGNLVSQHEPGLLNRTLRQGVSFLIAPFQKASMFVVSGGRQTVQGILSTRRLRRQNTELQRKVEKLMLENALLRERDWENRRLREALNYRREAPFQFLPAAIISRDPASWLDRAVVDQGTGAGIGNGSGVITPAGVVGRIMEANLTSSTVMLLPDPQSSVSGLDERSRVAGTVVGTGQGTLKMRHVSGEDDVQVGDLIVTSRLSSLFPPGLPIGEVTAVKPSENGLMLDIDLKPRVDFRTLDRVLLLKAGE